MLKKLILILALLVIPACHQHAQVFSFAPNEMGLARQFQQDCFTRGGTVVVRQIPDNGITITCKV